MPAVQGGQLFDDITRRWHALAERRLAHYEELYRSGRWRHYFRTQENFAQHMLDVIRVAKIWAELAGQQPPSQPDSVKLPPPAELPPAAPANDPLRPAA